MTTPKVFISYSWSSPTHERWVLDLAEELIASGVNIILDKWDLKPGQDSISFMEQMVTDKTIDKVLIISDKTYSEKADGRSGGVGTETQIISKKIYEQVDQERFIAVIAEKNSEGKAYTPTFYNSRLYIDLSEPDRYAEGFDSLIRCIHGQPQFVKPELGRKPEYLSSESNLNLGTSALFKRALSAIRDQKPFASGALEEYLNTFSESLEKIRIYSSNNDDYDDLIIQSIQSFTPSRNELLQIISASCRYMPQEALAETVHKFLESLTVYFYNRENRSTWRSIDFDNFKFIITELYLYIVTIFIKNNKLKGASILINQNYYLSNSNTGRPCLTTSECFYQSIESLEHRNSRLNLRRTSLDADIIKENNNGTGIDFNLLMQTDFILFVKNTVDKSGHWWPRTLVYLNSFHGSFEIFNRSVSQQYFESVKHLLNIQQKTDLDELLQDERNNGARYYGFGFNFNIKRLLNFDDLCTTK